MKRLALALFVTTACGGSPPPPASDPPPPPPPTVTPAPPSEPQSNVTPAPPEPTPEQREKRVIELLEGKVPPPDLPSDSGGG
jgi:hypothetical protein